MTKVALCTCSNEAKMLSIVIREVISSKEPRVDSAWGIFCGEPQQEPDEG